MGKRISIGMLSIVGALSLRLLGLPAGAAAAVKSDTTLHLVATQAEHLLGGVTSGDLKTEFSRRGMQCDGPRKQATRVAWSCSSTEGSTIYRVEFLGKSPTRIDYVTGTVVQLTPNLQQALQFLAFVASVPYSGGDPTAAQAWVRKQGVRDGERVIGTVILRRSGPSRALSLSLIPVGSDWQ